MNRRKYREVTLINNSQPFDEEKLPPFNFIWMYSVIFHLEDHKLFDALKFIEAHLADDGVCFTNTRVHNENKLIGKWRDQAGGITTIFPFLGRTFEFYQDVCKASGLFLADIGSIKEHGRDTITGENAQRMFKITKLAVNA